MVVYPARWNIGANQQWICYPVIPFLQWRINLETDNSLARLFNIATGCFSSFYFLLPWEEHLNKILYFRLVVHGIEVLITYGYTQKVFRGQLSNFKEKSCSALLLVCYPNCYYLKVNVLISSQLNYRFFKVTEA